MTVDESLTPFGSMNLQLHGEARSVKQTCMSLSDRRPFGCGSAQMAFEAVAKRQRLAGTRGRPRAGPIGISLRRVVSVGRLAGISHLR